MASKKSRRELIDEIGLEIRATQNRSDRYDELAAEIMGVNRTDLRCIDILDRLGPLPAGRLAEEMGLTSGAVTTVVDRLERVGYARRAADKDDRRKVLIEITPKAARLGMELYGGFLEGTQRLFAAYSEAELELVLDFLRRGAELGDEQLARLEEKRAQARRRRG